MLDSGIKTWATLTEHTSKIIKIHLYSTKTKYNLNYEQV